MPQKAGQAEISQPEPSPESAPTFIASERSCWILSFSSCAIHLKHLCREDQFTSEKQKCAAFNAWGFCMALLLSALLQHKKQGKASLLLKKCCIVNLWWSESPQPARGIALSWESLRSKENLPLQTPGRGDGDAVGRCCEDLDSSDLRQSQQMAIFQQRPLQPVVQPGKPEVDRHNLGMPAWCSPQRVPRDSSCATWASEATTPH